MCAFYSPPVGENYFMSTAFIIDDHPVIRLAVRFLLEKEGYTVIGECDNGVDAMQIIRENPPDLITLIF